MGPVVADRLGATRGHTREADRVEGGARLWALPPGLSSETYSTRVPGAVYTGVLGGPGDPWEVSTRLGSHERLSTAERAKKYRAQYIWTAVQCIVLKAGGKGLGGR